ncbi:MAG: hypothetical protein HY548_00030 [Elusimicrobia bacterium]|nr:hypothetical protein [Elusimicrobiota bacterium]
MRAHLYSQRKCRHCGKGFNPIYANQQMHPDCRPRWDRKYQREYQRKIRREMKMESEGLQT